MASKTPTQWLLSQLRSDGWLAEVVERWIPAKTQPGGGFRRDLFNLFDILAFRKATADTDAEIAGFQVTDYSNLHKHLNKYSEKEHAAKLQEWLLSQGTFYVVGVKRPTKTLPRRFFCSSYLMDRDTSLMLHTYPPARKPTFHQGIVYCRSET